MAYQGGRRILGYRKKQQNKRQQLKRHKKCIDSGSYFYYADKYYKRLSLSVCRGLCKKQTDRRIRKLPIEVEWNAPGTYRRVFDYWWTVF